MFGKKSKVCRPNTFKNSCNSCKVPIDHKAHWLIIICLFFENSKCKLQFFIIYRFQQQRRMIFHHATSTTRRIRAPEFVLQPESKDQSPRDATHTCPGRRRLKTSFVNFEEIVPATSIFAGWPEKISSWRTTFSPLKWAYLKESSHIHMFFNGSPVSRGACFSLSLVEGNPKVSIFIRCNYGLVSCALRVEPTLSCNVAIDFKNRIFSSPYCCKSAGILCSTPFCCPAGLFSPSQRWYCRRRRWNSSTHDWISSTAEYYLLLIDWWFTNQSKYWSHHASLHSPRSTGLACFCLH